MSKDWINFFESVGKLYLEVPAGNCCWKSTLREIRVPRHRFTLSRYVKRNTSYSVDRYRLKYPFTKPKFAPIEFWRRLGMVFGRRLAQDGPEPVGDSFFKGSKDLLVHSPPSSRPARDSGPSTVPLCLYHRLSSLVGSSPRFQGCPKPPYYCIPFSLVNFQDKHTNLPYKNLAISPWKFSPLRKRFRLETSRLLESLETFLASDSIRSIPFFLFSRFVSLIARSSIQIISKTRNSIVRALKN